MSNAANRRARAQEVARAAQLRRMAQERRYRRQRATWISAVAVAVLLIAGLTGAVLWQAGRPEGTPPASATADGTGLPVGDGPVTVEIYLDFLCPGCAAFEEAAGPVLAEYLADGVVTVVYRPIAILDQKTTTAYSSRAAAAAGCAAESGQLTAFVARMLAHQPVGQPAGLSTEQIIALGAEAGVTDPGFGECVRDGAYRDWVRRSTDAAFDRGVQGTPTVFVDGSRLSELSVPALRAAVEAAATG